VEKMARLYSKKRGKSGSQRPAVRSNPSWQRYTPEEIELITLKLAKNGESPSSIGLHLRDTYGIPDFKVIMGSSITAFLKEKKIEQELPEDLLALIRKSVFVSKHLEQNHKDMPAKRGSQLTQSKIRRLVKYYKKVGRLPQDWKFDAKNLRMYVE